MDFGRQNGDAPVVGKARAIIAKAQAIDIEGIDDSAMMKRWQHQGPD